MDAKWLWCDLETTGLNEGECWPIEIGMIVTDQWLNEIESFRSNILPPPEFLDSMEPKAREINERSGLLTEILSQGAPSREEVDPQASNFVVKHFGDRQAIMAGSSIHFDRRFIRWHLPLLETRLYRRMLDVSTFKEAMRVYRPDWLMEAVPGSVSHRVMDDMRGSMHEFSWYLRCMGVQGTRETFS
jgi:oligoribonuclease